MYLVPAVCVWVYRWVHTQGGSAQGVPFSGVPLAWSLPIEEGHRPQSTR